MNRRERILERKNIYYQGYRIEKQCKFDDATKEQLIISVQEGDRQKFFSALFPTCMKHNSEAPMFLMKTEIERFTEGMYTLLLGILNASMN